jgi:hypothetical protein
MIEVAKIISRLIADLLVNNELESMWKESAMASLEVLSVLFLSD